MRVIMCNCENGDLIWIRITDLRAQELSGKRFMSHSAHSDVLMLWPCVGVRFLNLKGDIIVWWCGAVVNVEICCSHEDGCLKLACVIFLSHFLPFIPIRYCNFYTENWRRKNFTQKLIVYFTNNYTEMTGNTWNFTWEKLEYFIVKQFL